tara:strand:- start:482 stop:1240 length:759 start_codon:yes stop_codon:yes gene_type:complete
MSNLGGLSFEDENNKKTIYVKAKPDGFIVQRIKGDEEVNALAMDEHERKKNRYRVRPLEMGTNKGDIVVERLFKEINNVQLIKVEEIENFGARIVKLHFNDMKEGSPNVCVQIPLLNSKGSVEQYATSLIDRVPNIEIGKFMNLQTFAYINQKGKDRHGFNIFQDGKEIKSAFWDTDTKTSKGNKPDSIKTTKLGKENWDFSDQSEFLIKIFNKFCIDIDKAFGNEITESKEANPKENSQVSQEADTVDLPF